MQRRIQGRGPGLLLDQIKGPKRNFFRAPPPPLSEGMDPPRQWDVKNYADRGGCYPTRLKAEVDNNAVIQKQLS